MTKQYELTGNAEPTLDWRDMQYISPFLPEEIPRSLDWSPSSPQLPDQGEQGACVANGHDYAMRDRLLYFKPSRQFMHNSTKVMGGYVGQYGVQVRDALQAAHKLGVCSEADYPYSDDMNNKVPPASAYEAALHNRVEEYESVIPVGGVLPLDVKLHAVMSALNEGMLVGLGIRVTQSIFNLTGPWLDQDYKVETKDYPATGRHYMTIVGYDMDRQMFKLANWWGEDYGDGGYLGLPFAVLDSFRPEAWCIRSFRGDVVTEKPGVFKNSLLSNAFSARLQVREELRGTTTNVWAGAVLPNGQVLIKHNQSDDSWLPIEQGLVPFLTDYPLKKINILSLITYKPDFRTVFAGTQFFAGYGDTAATMQYNKVWTI